jgi:hypothetical protein
MRGFIAVRWIAGVKIFLNYYIKTVQCEKFWLVSCEVLKVSKQESKLGEAVCPRLQYTFCSYFSNKKMKAEASSETSVSMHETV